jgi:large subunit ribosomal protein L4
MAKPKAPVLDSGGQKARELSLEEAVFAADVKPHLVHEAVRAELNARRAGTHAAKSRSFVAGGRDKPWRQKGTGRARAGTIRAPQFTGGGVAFPPQPRSYAFKVNRKEYRAAFRAALSNHAEGRTLGVLDGGGFGDEPSTKRAAEFLAAWGAGLPLLVVAGDDEHVVAKSFRNLERVSVVRPEQLEVAGLVWARSLLVTEAALETVERRAGGGGS